jgi:hypothetical protein
MKAEPSWLPVTQRVYLSEVSDGRESVRGSPLKLARIVQTCAVRDRQKQATIAHRSSPESTRRLSIHKDVVVPRLPEEQFPSRLITPSRGITPAGDGNHCRKGQSKLGFTKGTFPRSRTEVRHRAVPQIHRGGQASAATIPAFWNNVPF